MGGQPQMQPSKTDGVGPKGGVRLFRVSPRHPSADLEILLAVTGIVAWLSLTLLPLEAISPWLGECRFKSLAGIPCVSCGMTRGVLALAEGRVGAALMYNPFFLTLVVLVLAYTPVAIVSWLARLPRWRLRIVGRRTRWAIFAGVGLMLVINWVFLVYRGI